MAVDDDWLKSAQERVGLQFTDAGLLERALTHRSWAMEQRPRRTSDNERLEFLGDAVVGLAVGELLWRRHPRAPEGELARARARVVCESGLAEAFARTGLAPLLRLGRGEARSGGHERPSLLADAFEAVAGAVFVDQGWESARRFVLSHVAFLVERLPNPGSEGLLDPKSALQEHLQATSKRTPEYRLSSVQGPDHDKRFTAEVWVDGRVLGQGSGRSKKSAEQSAAGAALHELGVGSEYDEGTRPNQGEGDVPT